MSEYKLTQEIIPLSVAGTWDEAKLEWTLEEVYEADEPENMPLRSHTHCRTLHTTKPLE